MSEEAKKRVKWALSSDEECSFRENIRDVYKEYGEQAYRAVNDLIAEYDGSRKTDYYLPDALDELASVDDISTHALRKQILTNALNSTDSHIRYEALLGLSTLDDASSIPDIVALQSREQIPDMQKIIAQVLESMNNP